MTDTRLHHTSPWIVDTRALGLAKRHGPGSSHPLSVVAPAMEHTGTAVLAVPVGADVRIAALLESVAEGVLVSGTASATALGSCSRCLRDIGVQVSATLRELYAYPDSATAATTGDDEVPRLVGDALDLEPMVHDELVLAMPLAPVCSVDCRGLCPDCGERLDATEPDHEHETLDPRWAALAGLLSTEDATEPSSGGSAGRTVTGDDVDATAENIEEM